MTRKLVQAKQFNPVILAISPLIQETGDKNGNYTRIDKIITSSINAVFLNINILNVEQGAFFVFELPVAAKRNFTNQNQVTGSVSVLSNDLLNVKIGGAVILAEIGTKNQARIIFSFDAPLIPNQINFIVGASFQYSLDNKC